MTRRVIAFDTETALIRPALLAPPLVCVTWQELHHAANIEHVSTAEPRLRAWLEDLSVILVGHNVAYDLAVVVERFPHLRSLVFAAYAADRVTDTMIRQQLLDVAGGVYRGSVDGRGKRISFEYTLEALAKRLAGMQLLKDGWRLSYAEFLDTPLAEWPRRAREVQEAAKPRVLELEAQIADANAAKDDARSKALVKERDGIAEMIAGDPDRASSYPLDDARATLAVWEAQEKHAQYLKDQYRQARAAWALHLNSAWGLRTDADGVAKLRAAVEAELAEVEDELVQLGLVRADGTRDTKAAKTRMIRVCREEGISLTRTDTHFAERGGTPMTLAEREAQGLKPKCKKADGTPLDDEHPECDEHISLDAEACERSGDEVLIAYAERTTLSKQISNDIPALERGTEYPVHTRYGFAATGRSTSSKPPIQNLSKRPGFREAFVPRPGRLFAQADFPGLELYTWAQCCKSWFGFSRLADALNAGMDPHLILGAQLLKITYADALNAKKEPHVKRARQQAKPGNFGFAGGMGVPKFIATTRKQMGRVAFEELGLDEEAAKNLRDQWEIAWPEAKPHFDRVRKLCNTPSGRAPIVETLFTERFRGDATYCATANNGFQALGACCAKEAAWRIARAQYVGTPSMRWAAKHPGTTSPLFDARAVAFVHDEFISEVRDDEHAHDAAYEQAALMIEGANIYLPDVPIPVEKMEPLLMRRWSKNATPTFGANGRLIPWSM